MGQARIPVLQEHNLCHNLLKGVNNNYSETCLNNLRVDVITFKYTTLEFPLMVCNLHNTANERISYHTALLAITTSHPVLLHSSSSLF